MRGGGGVAGNRRLTAVLASILLVLLTVQVLSAIAFALFSWNVSVPWRPPFDVVRAVHFFVGFLLFPVIALKLASVGWRAARYYMRSAAYRAAGPPRPLPRLLAAPLVLSAVVLFGSGVEMWSFRNQLGYTWIAIHDIAAIAFTLLLAVHVAMHVREAARQTRDELRPAAEAAAVPGTVTRRGLLVGGAVAGVTLALGTAQWPSVALSVLAPRRAGDGPLDFPVMNFEGGGQRVDVARWRLRLSGAVRRPVVLTLDDLLALPQEERRIALNCVTGWTATRTWRGVAVARLLAMAGVDPDAGHVQVRSTSGYHWDHALPALQGHDALLATHVEGVPLDDDHGHPVRLVVAGVEGQANVKWVDGLIVGTGSPESYAAAHLRFGNQPVSGYFLPRDPAGRRP